MPISRRAIVLAPVLAAAVEVANSFTNPLTARAQALGVVLPINEYQHLPEFVAFKSKVFGDTTASWRSSVSMSMLYTTPPGKQAGFRPAGLVMFVTDPAANTRHGYSISWWPENRHFYQQGNAEPTESAGSLTIFGRSVDFAEVRVLAGNLTRAATAALGAKAGRRPAPK